MRTRDAEGTRRRILAAATDEFTHHGIAGARVDRIAAAAEVHKAQLYAYFGNKMDLFHAVFRRHADSLTSATPLDPHDLPAYAVAVHDAAASRPDLLRLLTWARLEGIDFPLDAAASSAKLEAVAAAQRSGALTTAISPADILALTFSAALTWSAVSITAQPGGSTQQRASQREALRLFITQGLAPPLTS